MSNDSIYVERLPSPRGGTLWSDGRGLSVSEAVMDGRRRISEQVSAQLSSVTETMAEQSSEGIEQAMRSATTVRTRFDRAELMQTLGVKKLDGRFIARVSLDKRTAIRAYLSDMAEATREIRRRVPRLRQGLDQLDTAVLLRAEYSLEEHMDRQRHRANILTVLDRETEVKWGANLSNLSQSASHARKTARIHIQVSGDASASVERAVIGQLADLFGAVGCTIEPAPVDIKAGVPSAVMAVALTTATTEENGITFITLGMSIHIRDARTQSLVFGYEALPEITHGGGTSVPLAEQGLVERLRDKLPQKLRPRLKSLSCR